MHSRARCTVAITMKRRLGAPMVARDDTPARYKDRTRAPVNEKPALHVGVINFARAATPTRRSRCLIISVISEKSFDGRARFPTVIERERGGGRSGALARDRGALKRTDLKQTKKEKKKWRLHVSKATQRCSPIWNIVIDIGTIFYEISTRLLRRIAAIHGE